MRDRASRYAAKKASTSAKKTTSTLLIAYVARTPKGKIRLRKIGIRFDNERNEEELVEELPPDDPRYVFENDYKVRKSTHDIVKKSAKFSRFYDASARVSYDL
jgi:hypothetical protein